MPGNIIVCQKASPDVGKRSDFVRRPNDAYDTWDTRVVYPLFAQMRGFEFVEPCAGNGTLIDLLERFGARCVQAFDIKPRRYDVEHGDARTARIAGPRVISNPPWTRSILHQIIANLAPQLETWLLFDAAWCFTRQAAPYLRHCHKIVVVGRLRWIEGSPHDAQDDCAWYLFGPDAPPRPVLIARD